MALTSFSRVRTLLILLALGAALFISVQARPPGCAGVVDPSFVSEIRSFAPLVLDGDQIITTIPGAVVRLNENGSPDQSFLVSVTRYDDPASIVAIAKDSQGRILIAGDFGYVNQSYRPGLARLLSDGQVDLAFNSAASAATFGVQTLAIQPNGKILVAGVSNNLAGQSTGKFLRLNEDGSADATFNPGQSATNRIKALAVQPNGDILVAGIFNNFDGQPRTNLCRLHPDGALDETFAPVQFSSAISGLRALDDGKILAFWSGTFYGLSEWFFPPFYPLSPPYTLTRLLPGGQTDSTFQQQTNWVADVVIQPDGKYILGGTTCRRIFPNGAPDPSFRSSASARNLALDTQSRIVGSGRSFTANGTATLAPFRLLNDGDDCVPIIGFQTNQISLIETNATISFPVIRGGNLGSTSTLQVFIDPSSDPSPQNFQPIQTNIIFTPGVVLQEIQLSFTDNRIFEPRHSFTLCLTNPSPGTLLGPDTHLNVTIADASSYNTPGSIDPNFTTNDPAATVPIGIPWNNKFYDTGYGAYRLFRLLADGSKDPTFAPPLFSTGVTVDRLSAIQVDPDGKVLVAGPFETINAISRPSLARINTDGSVDTSFNAGNIFGNIYYADIDVIFRLPNSSYLIGGAFSVYQDGGRYCLAHLSNSGALLGDFLTEAFASNTSWVGAIAAQPDGRVLVGGYSSERYLHPTAPNLVRFMPDGKPDDSFHAATNLMTVIDRIAVQPNGKIIVGGHDVMRGDTMRLNQDGSIDPTFYFNPPATGMEQIKALSFDSNGNLILQYAYASYTRTEVIRVNAGEYSGPGVCEILSSTAVENSTAKITVRRGRSSQGEARLRVKTRDATARAGEHYIATDTQVIFTDGESGEKQIEVPLIDNPAAADNLYFEAILTAESPGLSIAPNSNIATIHIIDDESGFILTELPATLTETNGYYTFAVRRTGPYTGPATVEVATDGGTATPNLDYKPILKTLTFDSPTNSIQRINLAIRNDYFPERPKTLRVLLRNPTGGAALFAPSTNIFTINDGLDGFAFRESIVSALPSQSFVQLLVGPISMADRPYGPITLRYKTVGGSAQPGVEYIPVEGTLDFSDYESAPKPILIPLLPNSTVGMPTTIQLQVTGLNGEPYLAFDTASISLQHPPLIAPPGSLDTRFNPLSFSSIPNAPIVSGNWIYACFDSFWDGFVRFNFDGVRDQTFHAGSSGPWLFPSSDGGVFTLAYTLRHLDSTGKLDESFQPNLPEYLSVRHLLPADDTGKILIAGTNYLTSQARPYILRLLPTGEVDKTFSAPAFENGVGPVTALAIQSDHRIFVAGSFTAINGVPCQNLARLLPDGQVDPTFLPAPDSIHSINKILPMDDGRILASGFFTIETNHADVARFNPDGSFDSTWRIRIRPNELPRHTVAAVDAAGRAYLLRYDVDQYIPTALVRTLSDGSRDSNFFPPPNIRQIFKTPNGLIALQQIPYGSQFIRLFIDPPTILRAPEILPNNRIAHTFNFPANTPYILEQTEDFVTWTELSSGSTTDGYVLFESDVPNSPRFYRVHSK